jgi:hypothetical protein
VEPSVVLAAALTTDADVPPLAGDAGAVVADALLDVLLELLPHAASSSEAANMGTSNFVV